MHGLNELARLLAAPSIVDPQPPPDEEAEDEEKKRPARKPGRQPDLRNLDEFEHIEVGDPRDGP